MLVAKMDRRFGEVETTTPLLRGISACHPASANFLPMSATASSRFLTVGQNRLSVIAS
jgi:hypothetical protein